MTTDQPDIRDIPEGKPSVNHSYFYMPPVWIGTTPTTIELNGPLINLAKIVCSRTLSVGIRIDAHRDGIFLFDFTGWPEGAPIAIPAHTRVGGRRLPENVLKAQKESDEHRYKDVSVMNAHLACMSTAMSTVQGHGLAVRQVITPSSYFTTHWDAGGRKVVGINPPNDPILAYVSVHYPLELYTQQGQRRATTIRTETVERSFDLLEEILTSETPDTLLMTNLVYLAATNYGEHDFPTALTFSWTVCEKLLRILWGRYIAEKTTAVDDAGKDIQVINKDRRKNLLQGRDYTASVVSETLALAGLLKHDIYLKLTDVRRTRNAWLHELTPITGQDANHSIQTAELFFKEITGIRLAVHLSYGSRL
jgi:hypothetical protein